MKISILIPTFNELKNIERLVSQLTFLSNKFEFEILFVDDDSPDGTSEKVMELIKKHHHIRLIRRIGRVGLSSAIREGLLNSDSDIALVMDGDGQHDPAAIESILEILLENDLDLVVGSRFHPEARILGLSEKRELGSFLANRSARFTLHRNYSHLTDYMSGFFALKLQPLTSLIRFVNVNGFKFLYELLALSKGRLKVDEVPLVFNKRIHGNSKLDISIFWDFLISLLHTFSFRIIPRRAISFALVGSSGVVVQLSITWILMTFLEFDFIFALPIAIISAAISNYLINNALTFRYKRLCGLSLFAGLLKFLIVASLPVIANVGLSTALYKNVFQDVIWAQMCGILVVFVWNYAASSAFVWNSPD